MPNHRKSFDVLSASGATEKNPQRFRDRKPEPKPLKPIGAPPKYLSDVERKVWREIVANALPGTLGNSDRIALEITSRLLAQFRAGTLTQASGIGQLVTMLTRLGMTPVDRNRLSAGETEETKPSNDEWATITSINVRRAG